MNFNALKLVYRADELNLFKQEVSSYVLIMIKMLGNNNYYYYIIIIEL